MCVCAATLHAVRDTRVVGRLESVYARVLCLACIHTYMHKWALCVLGESQNRMYDTYTYIYIQIYT